jgi:DNA-binding response OmpR family regulator
MNEIFILIVDDESRIRQMIKDYMSLEKYTIHEAGDGIDAIEMIKKNNYSIIILDVMMPKVDGWTVVREVRKNKNTPIIMLTARGEEYDKLLAFELGVDDYMVKPFSPKELLARVKAIIRRSFHEIPVDSQKESFEGLTIEFSSRNVYVDNKLIPLTPKEFELLVFLVKNKNRALSREQILTEVWGYDFLGDDRTIDTHIKMLRDSIKEYRKFIITVWGTGYKFEAGVNK